MRVVFVARLRCGAHEPRECLFIRYPLLRFLYPEAQDLWGAVIDALLVRSVFTCDPTGVTMWGGCQFPPA